MAHRDHKPTIGDILGRPDSVDHSAHKLCDPTIGCVTAWAEFPEEDHQGMRVLYVPPRKRSWRRPQWWQTFWRRPGTVVEINGVVWKLHRSRPGIDYGWKYWSEVRDGH